MMKQKTMNVSEPITLFSLKSKLVRTLLVQQLVLRVALCFECATQGIGGAGMLSLVKANLVDFVTAIPFFLQFKPVPKNSV